MSDVPNPLLHPNVPASQLGRQSIKLGLEGPGAEKDGPFLRIQVPKQFGPNYLKVIKDRALELWKINNDASAFKVEEAKVYLTYRDVENDQCFIFSEDDLRYALPLFPMSLRVFARVDVPKLQTDEAVPPIKSTSTQTGSDRPVENLQVHRVVESVAGVLTAASLALKQHVRNSSGSVASSKRSVVDPSAANKETHPTDEPSETKKDTHPSDSEEKCSPGESSAPETTSQVQERPFIHGRHTCDGCLTTPILGKRFHAMNLPDYDLCSKCYSNYKGDEIVFEEVELDRDACLQDRWNRRFSKLCKIKKQEQRLEKTCDKEDSKQMKEEKKEERKQIKEERKERKQVKEEKMEERKELRSELRWARRESRRSDNPAINGPWGPPGHHRPPFAPPPHHPFGPPPHHSPPFGPHPPPPPFGPHPPLPPFGPPAHHCPPFGSPPPPFGSPPPHSSPSFVPHPHGRPFGSTWGSTRRCGGARHWNHTGDEEQDPAMKEAIRRSILDMDQAQAENTEDSEKPVLESAVYEDKTSTPESKTDIPEKEENKSAGKEVSSEESDIPVPAVPTEENTQHSEIEARDVATEETTEETVGAATKEEIIEQADPSSVDTEDTEEEFEIPPPAPVGAPPAPRPVEKLEELAKELLNTPFEDESGDDSFADDAVGSGPVAEELGKVFDKFVTDLNEFKTTIDGVKVETITSSVASNETGVTILRGDDEGANEDSDDESGSSWDVVNDDLLSNDEALAHAAQVVGSALFESGLSRAESQPSDSQSICPVPGMVFGESSCPSSVPSLSSGSSAVPSVSSGSVQPIQLERWAYQLSLLHELGFDDDERNVEILERFHAANIGSDELVEVSVERVVNELMKYF